MQLIAFNKGDKPKTNKVREKVYTARVKPSQNPFILL